MNNSLLLASGLFFHFLLASRLQKSVQNEVIPKRIEKFYKESNSQTLTAATMAKSEAMSSKEPSINTIQDLSGIMKADGNLTSTARFNGEVSTLSTQRHTKSPDADHSDGDEDEEPFNCWALLVIFIMGLVGVAFGICCLFLLFAGLRVFYFCLR